VLTDKSFYFKEWDARLTIERSKAIKCPTIQYQLAGTKKIQQELARQGAVEKFISDEKEANKIRSVFAGQYSLDLVRWEHNVCIISLIVHSNYTEIAYTEVFVISFLQPYCVNVEWPKT
jgi:menaquinone-dependent protoporphyrinogen IX oxidase